MSEERILGQDAEITRSQFGYVSISVKSMGIKEITARWHDEWDDATTISTANFNKKMDILEAEARKEVEKEIRRQMTEALKRAKSRGSSAKK